MRKVIFAILLIFAIALFFGCTSSGLNNTCPDGSINITGECDSLKTTEGIETTNETNTGPNEIDTQTNTEDNTIQRRQSKSTSNTPEETETIFDFELAPIQKRCYNRINTTNKELICLEEFDYPICNTTIKCGTGFECFDGHCFEEKENTIINSLECLEDNAIGANCGGGKLTSETIVTTTLYKEDHWADAQNFCETLDNGYDDWRLPTKEEIADAYTIIGDRGQVWMNTTQDTCTLRAPQRCGLGYKTYETQPFICIRETQKRQLLKEEEPYIPEIFPSSPQPPDGVTVIGTCQDLQDIRNNPNGNYLLDFDIDCTDFAFEPITKFNGTLDGDDWEITNLKINSNEEAAIFKFISYKATIKNLTITDIEITSAEDAAGLAVESVGKLENIKLTGTIKGKNAGGITTFNHGHIKNNQVIARVQSYSNEAGMVASHNQGAITNTEYEQKETNTLALAITTTATTCIGSGIPAPGCTQITKDPICDTSNQIGIGSDQPNIGFEIYGEIPELSDKGNKEYNKQRGGAISSEFSALKTKVHVYTSGYNIFPITYKLRNNDTDKYIKSGTVTGCIETDPEYYECNLTIYSAKDPAWDKDVRRRLSSVPAFRPYQLKHKIRNLQLEVYINIDGKNSCEGFEEFTSEHPTPYNFQNANNPDEISTYPLMHIQLESSGQISSQNVSEMMRSYESNFYTATPPVATLLAFNLPYYPHEVDPYNNNAAINTFIQPSDQIYRRIVVSKYLPSNKQVLVNNQQTDFAHLLLGTFARSGIIADGQIFLDGPIELVVFSILAQNAGQVLTVETIHDGLHIRNTLEKQKILNCPNNNFWEKTIKVLDITRSTVLDFQVLDPYLKEKRHNANSPDFLGDWYGALLNRKFRGSAASSIPDFLDAQIPTLPNYKPKADELQACFDWFWDTFIPTP